MTALSVVVPVHNEAGNVRTLCDEIRWALERGPDYEVVFVDDASGDDTLAVLAELRRADMRIRVLHHEKRCGQSAALLSGVRAARAEWVVTLDGDCQNDPGDIPRLLAARDTPGAPADLGLVNGHRRLRRDSRLRRWSSRVANAVRAALLRDATADSGCGLRLFRRDMFLALPFFDHMHRFVPALMLRQGGAVLSVEVNHRPRKSGHSHYGISNRVWVGIADLLGVYWLQRRMKLPVV
ncbi:MAG TPA: glycosyltransferase family 2 protein, partial [Pseudomonadales bacterium]